MQIKDLDVLFELLSKNPYIKNQNIHFEERSPDTGIIKGVITFIDDSSLHLKQFFTIRPEGINILKYGYHCETKEKDLIFRYDNAADPDAESFSTYPSHKHTPNGIKEANMPTMQQVLDEISQRILQNLDTPKET